MDRAHGHLVPRKRVPDADDASPQHTAKDAGARSWLQQRYAPYVVIAATLAMACVDGAVRANNGAMTLMGEDPAGHMTELVAAGMDGGASVHHPFLKPVRQSQLIQNTIGQHCEFQYNCLTALVCREGQCAACESTDECQKLSAERQCFNATGSETHSTCGTPSLLTVHHTVSKFTSDPGLLSPSQHRRRLSPAGR